MNEQTTPAGDGPAERAVGPLPCPFCGCPRIGVHLVRRRRSTGYQCMCLGCRVAQTHSLHDSQAAAVAVWNQRPNVALTGPPQAGPVQ